MSFFPTQNQCLVISNYQYESASLTFGVLKQQQHVCSAVCVVTVGVSKASRGTDQPPSLALLRCLGHFGSGIGALSQKLEVAFIWILPSLKILFF